MLQLRSLHTTAMAAMIAISGLTTLTQAVAVPEAAAATVGSSLPAGGTLAAGQCLGNGPYALCMQTDGNVVEYSSGRAIWTTGTANQGGSRLVNQSDGNFVLYSPDNRALWNSGTSGRGATTVLTQTDGNVVSYAGASPVWNTYTAGGVSRLASSSAVAFARRQLGKPYVYGSAGPNSYDCSGLTMATYATVGVSLPHRASDQFRLGTPVDASQLIPGDLVFSYSGPGHVGIYVGNGLMISSPNSNSAVRYDPAGEYGNYVGARRVA